MSSIQKLVEEARNLPDDQKLTLANRVLELAEQAMTGDVEEEWDSELRARIRAYDEGRSPTKPAGLMYSASSAEPQRILRSGACARAATGG